MKRFWGLTLVFILVWTAIPVGARGASLTVDAKSALLMDVATGTVLMEQHAHEPLAPASVTKVMTMLLIMEAIDSGRIGWEDSVIASETAAAKGGSQIYLKVGETMSVADMVKSIAVSSANDCACAMAEHIAGSEEAKAHRTSAHDIALMSRELLKNHPDIKKYTTIWMDTVRQGEFGLSNTNKLVRFYPGCTGLKTGFTSGAGYCLSASAERDGMELIAVVMGCETSQDRFQSCKRMLDYGFATYALVKPELQGTLTVPVTLGKSREVPAVPGDSSALLIDKALKNSVTTDITMDESVQAPVSKGQRLGTMTVRSGDRVLAQVPMVAETAVERLRFGDIFLMLLKKVFMVKGA